MHRPQGTWIVAITIHILSEHGSARDVCFKQPVSKLLGVESLAQLRHMPGSMVFDVDLPYRPRRPRGDARIDPELLRDATRRGDSGGSLRSQRPASEPDP